MYFRLRIEIDIPEDPGEAEEILVLAPGSGGKPEYSHRQPVFSLRQHFCQIKLRRVKAVLAVADILSVHPQGKAALHPLEGNKDSLILPGLRHRKVQNIIRYGIILLRYFAGLHVLPAVPGILGIHILGAPIPLELDMRRHPDPVPARRIKISSEKVLRRRFRIHGIMEFPNAVQNFP